MADEKSLSPTKYFDRRKRLEMAATLCVAGVPVKQAAELLGISPDTLRAYMKKQREAGGLQQGVGLNKVAARAHAVLQATITALQLRIEEDGLGDAGNPKDVRHAARLFHNISGWPGKHDERVQAISEAILSFLEEAVSAGALDIRTLSAVGKAVAPMVQSNQQALRQMIERGERPEIFVAERLVQRTEPVSRPEPELDERGRRIMRLVDGLGAEDEE